MFNTVEQIVMDVVEHIYIKIVLMSTEYSWDPHCALKIYDGQTPSLEFVIECKSF